MFVRLATLLVLAAASKEAPLSEGGCDPSCTGECFSGTCLFSAKLDDNLDHEDAELRSQVPILSAAALHGTVHERATQAEPPAAEKRVNAQLHQVAGPASGGGAFDAKSLGLDLRPDMGLPLARGAAASGLVPSKAASEFAADLSVPTALQFGKRRSFLSSDQVLSQSAATVEKMKGDLGEAQATEEKLQTENRELKTEIEEWRAAGAHVADREATAVEALQHASVSPEAMSQAPEVSSQSSGAADLSLLSRTTSSTSDLGSLASREVPGRGSFWHAMLAIATCMTLGVIWIALEVSGHISKIRPSWHRMMGPATRSSEMLPKI